ncbi:nucleotidyl transferase AbiEii/AbiGii toxin family protein [Stenotrophomonas sp.]|uniref:nucleotidyl transferase AbiEii/AbiGii toxin family protein n=1 Tax=Stenotrophomonas sp. TaxID=69392 RepID=UPI0028B1745C|nr:nucleotidyl transferase AbiEii/AbiGii toxin family protein [Stenotrophomonas sp.]
MNAEGPSAQLCADVADALRLPHPGLVEKDFHVVRALAALQRVDAEGARLVFGGGTSLCRAYRLIERMSEDIDLRIVATAPLSDGGRRRFRKAVTEALLSAGFTFDPDNRDHLAVHDGGRTFVYNLPYPRASASVASLRPIVKVEISSWPLQCAPAPCAVSTFVSQARERPAELPEILCVDVAETAADKFVALTRRIAEEQVAEGSRDASLLRHIYDLHRITPVIDLKLVQPVLQSIMESDRKTRGARLSAYSEDPRAVSRNALRLLAEDEAYAAAFAEFQRDMVYGVKASLADCLPVLDQYAELM